MEVGVWSDRGEAGWIGDRLPQLPEVEPAGDGLGDLEDEVPAGLDDVDADVDHLPAQPGGVAGQLHRPLEAVLLEGLVQVEGGEHHVEEGGVGLEAAEGELLGAEVLERLVHQLVPAPEPRTWRIQDWDAGGSKTTSSEVPGKEAS